LPGLLFSRAASFPHRACPCGQGEETYNHTSFKTALFLKSCANRPGRRIWTPRLNRLQPNSLHPQRSKNFMLLSNAKGRPHRGVLEDWCHVARPCVLPRCVMVRAVKFPSGSTSFGSRISVFYLILQRPKSVFQI
jgi:hypothetical protein